MRYAVCLLLALGCNAPKDGTPAAPKSAAPASKAAVKSVPKPAAKTSVVSKAIKKAAAPKRHAKGGAIKWDGPIKWQEWDAAQTLAKESGKPICLVVYADWCPRCKELAPAFQKPEIIALAEKMIMVKQDSDLKPAWLQQFSTLGGYVPRIFFFSPDGSLRDDITSEHPRYPYFYTPRGLDTLERAMQTAIKG